MMWMFQSAPPPLGGGDLDRDQLDENPNCFNPRPPRLEGATPYHGVGASDGVVSIRAPPAWRGRLRPMTPRAAQARFNPRPPRLEGATSVL